MAGKTRSNSASQSVSVGSTKTKKLSQRSILDLFPKKQKPALPVSVNGDDILEQKEKTIQDASLNLDDGIELEKAMASSSNSNLPRFISPEIQIIDSPAKATGLWKDDPIIVVESSPVKQSYKRAKVAAPPKAIYSIFAPLTNREPSLAPVSPKKDRASHLQVTVPFPVKSTQHVRGPQTTFIAPPTYLPPRKHVPCPSNFSVPLSYIISSPPTQDPAHDSASTLRFATSKSRDVRAAHLANIPTEHLQSYPVIAHLVEIATKVPESTNDVHSAHSHQLWADKWHPLHADHVLGNEKQSAFLRHWLCALQVQSSTASAPPASIGKERKIEKRGTKRRNVIRAVDKRPGRKRQRVDSDDDDDSWIVHTDEMEEEEESPPADLDLEEPSTRRRLYRRSSYEAPPSFQDRLTNTILLSGPHSSGKTTAVYACAEELGWEVFEVYPGVGKRSGVNLDNLVGEVGKNHLVRKTRLKNGDSGNTDGSLKSAFARAKADDYRRLGEESNALEDVDVEIPRQSLILLEEVDILFKEDVNFWSSLVNLIKECKRPVILTCNDISLVPVADLPLQDILNFQLCSTPVATSFLQVLSCAEGYLLERDVVSQLYENSGTPDLRRAIHNLQLWCPENPLICSQDDTKNNDMLWSDTSSIDSRQADLVDLISFADCYLSRQLEDTPKELSMNEGAAADDVLGYRTVPTNGSTFFNGRFGYHDHDELIMSTALWLSRGPHDRPRRQALLQTRVSRYDEMVKEFGNNVLRSQIRRPEFDLDYLPWIREIVAAEDKQEAAMGTGTGRRTRNSQRYVRTIELSENAQKGLNATVLGSSLVNPNQD